MFANRFALLDDDAAPANQPKAAAPTSSPTTAQAQDGTAGKLNKGERGGRGGRGARGGARPPAASGAVSTTNAEGPEGDDPVRDDRAGSGRGRGRGRGGARGARGARGGRGGRSDRPDRHSATGQEDSDKKVNQGWGGDEGQKELADEDQGATDARDEAAPATDSWGDLPDDAPGATPANDTSAVSNHGGAAKDAAPAEEEAVDNSKTYEEYLAEKAQNVSLGSNTFQLRKANEGADESQWSSGVAMGRKDDHEETFFIGKQAANKSRKQKEDKRQFIEIEPTFAPRDSESRGRGRGRGFRGRGEGSPRGQSFRGRGEGFRGRGFGSGPSRPSYGGRSEPQVDTNNEADFPSL